MTRPGDQWLHDSTLSVRPREITDTFWLLLTPIRRVENRHPAGPEIVFKVRHETPEWLGSVGRAEGRGLGEELLHLREIRLVICAKENASAGL